MRIVRVLLGVLFIAVAVIAFLSVGAGHIVIGSDQITTSKWPLIGAGVLLAVMALALLLWPQRDRPSDVPSVQRVDNATVRLSVETASGAHAAPDSAATAHAGTHAAPDAADAGVPSPRLPLALEPAPTALALGWASPSPREATEATDAESGSGGGLEATPDTAAMIVVFADPVRRPDTLSGVVRQNQEASAALPPLQTNEQGVYRSVGSPPPVSPVFEWVEDDPRD